MPRQRQSARNANPGGQRKSFPQSDVIFDYEVVVPVSDGHGLHVNIYRPMSGDRVPVLITHGVYGKDVRWATAKPYRRAWKALTQKLPQLGKTSTLAFMRWEMPDPEHWVRQGYALIQADARGSGKTPGALDVLSPREIEDYKNLIEWAVAQDWCNGRAGLMGISYYAISQWRVAALKPKGLAAIMPWEGAFDHYRDIATHGGIPSTFFARNWYRRQVLVNAFGNTRNPLKDAITGGPACSSDLETRSATPLTDLEDAIRLHPFHDGYHRQRTPDPDAIETPLLSVGNWGGAGLHLRGNVEGYLAARSAQKWLRLHAGDHFSPFYRDNALAMQKRFLDRFLKGADNGWDREPRIRFAVRDPSGIERERTAEDWPLPETNWTRLYLDPRNRALVNEIPSDCGEFCYGWSSSGVTFIRAAQVSDFKIAGPIAVRLWVRPARTDMDLFVVLRLFDPSGRDVTFEGANSPRHALAQGWLRLSHREIDTDRSRPWRPYHKHERECPAVPGRDYQLDIEVWPTCVVVPVGYRLGFTVLARDFVFPGWRNLFASAMSRLSRTLPPVSALAMQGSAPFLHDNRDRKRFGGTQTILCGGKYDSSILLPLVPDQ